MQIPHDPTPNHRIRLSAIVEALSVIDPVFLNSPQYECEPLSEELACNLILKLETANPIRSFKGRGGHFLIAKCLGQGFLKDRLLVAASAGNWGQALAHACRAHNLPITIFASVNANPLKISRMEKLGAKMVLQGEDYDAARLAMQNFAREQNALILEDGFNVEASEGAGTIAVELMQMPATPDVIVVPLGGGAMLTGIARWIKAISPSTQVIGVQPRGADAMEKSWRNNKTIEIPSVNTIADGLAIRVPIVEALVDMKGLIDDVILVDDSSIIAGMKLLYSKAGVLAEPSGAAGVAAILENQSRFKGLRVATPICGGNVTEAHVKQHIF